MRLIFSYPIILTEEGIMDERWFFCLSIYYIYYFCQVSVLLLRSDSGMIGKTNFVQRTFPITCRRSQNPEKRALSQNRIDFTYPSMSTWPLTIEVFALHVWEELQFFVISLTVFCVFSVCLISCQLVASFGKTFLLLCTKFEKHVCHIHFIMCVGVMVVLHQYFSYNCCCWYSNVLVCEINSPLHSLLSFNSIDL
jgi:hypothetical protein